MALDGMPRVGRLHLDFSALPLDDEPTALLDQERHEFEAVLGLPVTFAPASPGAPRWMTRPSRGEPPALSWDPATATLTSAASDECELMTTLGLLQTLAHSPSHTVRAEPATTVNDAIELIRTEIATTYPYLALRGLDWDAITVDALRHRPGTWDCLAPWAIRWVARLGDAHTAVVDHRATGFNPLYTAELHDDGAHLLAVPERSPAYRAGVRPGWVVRIDDPEHWLTTTGASPQQHLRMAARRALAVTGSERTYAATEPGAGRPVEWVEPARAFTLDDLVAVQRNPSGAVVVTLRAFDPRVAVESVFDDLAASATSSSHLVLDVRGTMGGSIMLAGRLRDRFLRQPTSLGSIRFTDGRGGLSQPTPRTGEPAPSGRWPGRLTVITDATTYSAAEDFLLGLRGLDHVTVLGERTGGGSGRPRVLPLGPDLTLRISTAITYDRDGCPVEYHGIAPDGPLTRPVAEL